METQIDFKKLIALLGNDELDCTSFPVIGLSPWAGDCYPTGIWSWDEPRQLVLIGTCQDDAEIVSYERARQIFNIEIV